MKLRTRLFLWIGSLFLFFAFISYALEAFLVHRHLKKSKQELRKDIQKNEEQKRRHFEEFLGIVMADFQAKIDALLYRLNENPSLRKNISNQSWFFSSNLLLENGWIGYIQNTNEKKYSSLVIPSAKVLKKFQKKEINEDLAWIHFYDEPKDKVYIGIKISSKEMKEHFSSFSHIQEIGLSDQYCFYDPNLLKDIDFKVKSLSRINSFTKEEIDRLNTYRSMFLQKLEKAKAYVKEFSYEGGLFQDEKTVPQELLKRKHPHLSDLVLEEFHESFVENIRQGEVIRQIWTLNTLLLLDLFGPSPIDRKAPMGIASLKAQMGLFSDLVLFDTKMLDDQEHYLEHPPQKGWKVPSSLALMKAPFQSRVFLGNTLQYADRCYLSVGIDISDMLQRLSLAASQYVLLAYGEKVLTVYNPEGVYLPSSFFYQAQIKKLKKDKGMVILNGKKYYYLSLQPYKNLDLHFYILELETKAFSFVTSIVDKMISLINHISFSMRAVAFIALFIVLILLHNIAKKISRPISQLAKMMNPVAEGHYEKVEIPKTPLGPSQEIHTLCQSFSEMVNSLKDKEKVRAVLNKVVSKEIAEEILKDSVHLGGEEKTVTILFADIRNFTKITEKMAPQEVIELLNLTMTKISQVIDQYKGVIDKFVGDEVMALFGAPIQDDLAVMRAIITAKEIVQSIKQFNEIRRKEKKVEIHVGIGIHTGVVVAGNMGAENRLNYTVLGSNVNLASRVCSVAKEDEILITKNTLQGVQKGTTKVKELDPISFKGFTDAITVYSLQEIFFDLPPKRIDA